MSDLEITQSTDDDHIQYIDEKSPLTRSTASEGRYVVRPWLVITTLVCIFGSSFQFGFNITVVNAIEEVIQKIFWLGRHSAK